MGDRVGGRKDVMYAQGPNLWMMDYLVIPFHVIAIT